MMRTIRSIRRWGVWLGLISLLWLTACSSTSVNSIGSQPVNSLPMAAATSSSVTMPSQASTLTRPAATLIPELTVVPTEITHVLPPTPVCSANLKTTPAQTEGPYYKPNTPERSDLLITGTTGTKLIVTGYVLTTDCKPVAGAWLDFWQADDAGQYDNAGYTLRGHQTTDESGRYYLETIVPGRYPGRTRHIHVKVQAPNSPALTTQLYFPNEPANNSDSIFNPALIANVQDTADGKVATFNFVLNIP